MSDRLFSLEQQISQAKQQAQQGLSSAQTYEDTPQTNRLLALEQSLILPQRDGFVEQMQLLNKTGDLNIIKDFQQQQLNKIFAWAKIPQHSTIISIKNDEWKINGSDGKIYTITYDTAQRVLQIHDDTPSATTGSKVSRINQIGRARPRTLVRDEIEIKPTTEAAQRRDELDTWLQNTFDSLRPLQGIALQMGINHDSRCRAQRRLLVDAMFAIDSSITVNNTPFLNNFSQWFHQTVEHKQPKNRVPLPELTSFINITWCDAINAVSTSLGKSQRADFNAQLKTITDGRLSNREKIVLAALLMRGCYKWKKRTRQEDNDFGKWLKEEGNEPNQQSTMNCWEAIYFAAYKVGLYSKDQLYQSHKSGIPKLFLSENALQLWSVESPMSLNEVLSDKEFSETILKRLKKGDILFFDDQVEQYAHVVLVIEDEKDKVMSLWTNGTGGTFDVTTVSELAKLWNPEKPLNKLRKRQPFA